MLLEDLEVPGAVLCPQLDDAGVMLTIQQAQAPRDLLERRTRGGALGVKPHNGPWYQPGWGDDIAAYWPRFVRSGRSRTATQARASPEACLGEPS